MVGMSKGVQTLNLTANHGPADGDISRSASLVITKVARLFEKLMLVISLDESKIVIKN